ncbi:MAG: DUF2170 family protein [Alphaproteobacteria bacterium]|nr:DUF2170 family protein [Alphaproteobacteria bacterium]
MDINKLAEQLVAQGKEDDIFSFKVQPIHGDVEVLKVTVEDREELPVFLSIADTQILCISYLFKKDEIISSETASMNEAMLSMNVQMPLSSFAMIDEQYVVFGALSVNSTIDDIVHEIEMLSDNTLEALEAMKAYFK